MFINAQLMHSKRDCWTSSGFAHAPTEYYITSPIKPHPQSVCIVNDNQELGSSKQALG